ncbi:MAG: hypothetical protein DLM62_11665 [Pseudonocardiales bacterium]|nr:MAG: hypothetical protein DLM62_11665 [Pseudonocardiales bacterium]
MTRPQRTDTVGARVYSDAANSCTELGNTLLPTVHQLGERGAMSARVRTPTRFGNQQGGPLTALAAMDRRFDFGGVLAVPFGSPRSGTDEALSEMVLRC